MMMAIFISLLNNGNTPQQLRISRQYRQMLHKITVDRKRSWKSVKINLLILRLGSSLRGKLESARWFINSINQRRQTMMKVMKAIVEIQEEFFKFGEGYLKPMILKDVAEKDSNGHLNGKPSCKWQICADRVRSIRA